MNEWVFAVILVIGGGVIGGAMIRIAKQIRKEAERRP